MASPQPRPNLSKVSPPPRQLSPRAKELIARYHGSQWVLLIIGVVFMAMGSVFAVIFGWGVWVDVAIGWSSEVVPAVVSHSELNRSVTINGEHPVRTTFRYTFSGQTYDGSSSAIGDPIRDMDAEMEVEVAAGHPSWARVRGTRYATFPIWVLGIVGVFPTVGVLLVFFAVRSNRRETRAYSHGIAALGQVTFAGEDLSTSINGRHPFQVQWSFEAEDGRSYEGSLSHMKREALGPLAGAKEIIVLYDRFEPKSNTVYLD